MLDAELKQLEKEQEELQEKIAQNDARIHEILQKNKEGWENRLKEKVKILAKLEREINTKIFHAVKISDELGVPFILNRKLAPMLYCPSTYGKLCQELNFSHEEISKYRKISRGPERHPHHFMIKEFEHGWLKDCEYDEYPFG